MSDTATAAVQNTTAAASADGVTVAVHPFERLGGADHGWLNAKHHFSFAEYFDPAKMGVGPLRVWNDDAIQPGTGFPFHPHRDMEIITYVREGAITHKDSLGNEGRTAAGDVQVMSAGTGIVHSEYNLEDAVTTLFQIWIMPDAQGHQPRWDARDFPKAEAGAERLKPLASGRAVHASDDPLMIHADAAVLAATLTAGQSLTHDLEAGRALYLVPAKGAVTVNGTPVGPRDGATVAPGDGGGVVVIESASGAEVVAVDVPAAA
jgi:redox-sensitive bicupin YhaK (pirin superfamily)